MVSSQRSEVSDRRVVEDEARDALTRRRRVADGPLELEPAARDQVVADVMRAIGGRALRARLLGGRNGALRDVELARARSPRQLLDRFPVAIACRPIHVGVRAGGIAPEDSLHTADRLDKRRPVERRQHAHGADDVGDGELIDGLALLFDAQHFVSGLASRAQSRLQPPPCGGRRDRLVAQVVENLDEKGRRCLVGELSQTPLGLRNLQQLRRERPRGVSVLPRAQRLHGEAAEILDERQPQHDRYGPELADRERRDVLVGVGKSAQQLLVETPGGVGDEAAREHIDARIAAPSSADERRQLFVIASREIPADFEQLRADDVVVIAQPFFGRRLGRLGESRFREFFVDLLEARRVAVEAGQQLAPRAAAPCRGMPGRKFPRMGLELIQRQRRAAAFEVIVYVRLRAGHWGL